MTNNQSAANSGGIHPSQNAGTPHSVRLRHLMEERQRLEIAARVTQLRERSPWTQPEIAEKLRLTLRGYQKIEEKGTTKYERCQEIAAVHDVDADWLWDGREKGATPDPFASEAGVTAADLLAEIRSLRNELLAEIGKVRTAQAAQPRRRASAGRGKAANGS